MEKHQIIDYGKIGDLYYVICGQLKLKGRFIQNDDGYREYFHSIEFDVTTYKDGEYHYNSNNFITRAFDNNEKFIQPFKTMNEAFHNKLQQIKNELMIVGEVVEGR